MSKDRLIAEFTDAIITIGPQRRFWDLRLVLLHWRAGRLEEAYVEAMGLDEESRELIPQMVWDQIDQGDGSPVLEPWLVKAAAFGEKRKKEES
tara:strand:+ start:238 stop:516 length:279 start_codon:yes stop_codon:yes gene_type:complete